MRQASANISKVKLFNTAVSSGTYNSFISEITSLASRKISSYVCVMNVHMLMEAYQDDHFARVVSEANLITPDGVPIALAIQQLYRVKQDRVAGMDLISSLFQAAEKDQIGVFLYGSTEPVLNEIRAKCKKEYPNLIISGASSPPFRPLDEAEERAVINKINGSGAGMVFVALGCPKQEKWMSSMKGKINATMIGLGGAFPVYAGMQKRAPEWMQRSSLEWLYRLVQEPGRLWKRYFVTNSLFLVVFTKSLIANRRDQALKRNMG